MHNVISVYCKSLNKTSEIYTRGDILDALERFRSELRGWVNSYNRVKNFTVSPDEVLGRLESRIPVDRLRQIGAAFINGWLVNENAPHRRYFVKESDRPGPGGGQWTLEPDKEGSISPCWELYVQLSDYGRLRTVAERQGLEVCLEDNLMDITVYSGNKMILYVENKTDAATAKRLINKMKECGEFGFQINDSDVGNDGLKKAKYLVRNGALPKFIGVTAKDFEKVFEVEYAGKNNRYVMHERKMTLTEPLKNIYSEKKSHERSIVDSLALELERLACDKIWASPGSGATACNFYVPCEKGDILFLGVYKDGSVWSHLSPLSKVIVEHLSFELSEIGVTLDTSKDWAFWRKNGQVLNLKNEDSVAIAKALFSVVSNRI